MALPSNAAMEQLRHRLARLVAGDGARVVQPIEGGLRAAEGHDLRIALARRRHEDVCRELALVARHHDRRAADDPRGAQVSVGTPECGQLFVPRKNCEAASVNHDAHSLFEPALGVDRVREVHELRDLGNASEPQPKHEALTVYLELHSHRRSWANVVMLLASRFASGPMLLTTLARPG